MITDIFNTLFLLRKKNIFQLLYDSFKQFYALFYAHLTQKCDVNC